MADSVEEEIRVLRSLMGSERDPEGRAFAPLADAHRRRGEHGEAVRLLGEGLDRHAGFAPGFIVAGWVRREIGEVEGADQAFAAALALDPENTEALRGLGELAAERGDHQTAIAHYQKLNELAPDDLEIVARLRELDRAAAAPPVPEGRLDGEVLTEADTGSSIAAASDAAPPDPDPEPAPADSIVADAPSGEAAADRSFLEPLGLDTEPFDSAEPFDSTEAASFAPSPDAEGEADGGDGPITRTMADLYAKQGLHERALRVYRQLLQRDPWDDDVRLRVAALEKAVEPAAPEPRREKAAEVDTETLARDWSEGPRATEPIETPFAWTAPTGEPSEPPATERPARDYFRGLLEWEPAPPETVSSAEATSAPAAAESIPADPTPVESIASEPLVPEPPSIDPSVTASVEAEPVPAEPIWTESVWTETTWIEPAAAGDPAAPEAVHEEPVTEAAPLELAAASFLAIDPIGFEPVTDAPVVDESVPVVEPLPVELVVEPVAVDLGADVADEPVPVELGADVVDEPVALVEPVPAELVVEPVAVELGADVVDEPVADEPVARVEAQAPVAVESIDEEPALLAAASIDFVDSVVGLPAVEAAADDPWSVAPTPVETLAPERVVAIESLAPDGIVPIESLAPVIVDIASLAP